MESKTFAEWLRGELDRQDVSVSELARRLRPLRPELARRRIFEYLSGAVESPGRLMRLRIAQALNVDPKEMP